MNEQKERELSVQQAAEREGVHRNTIYRWIDEHGLQAERKGPHITRIKESSLENFKKQFTKE